VSRWQPDAGSRLERAALELFVEQGFADTTVPQITERAGLTTRTFFRYFPDKREVLFAFDTQLPAIVERLMAQAAPGLGPMGVIRSALETVATVNLADQREHLDLHRSIVQSDDGLRERELRKHSILAEATRLGFLARGTDELTATLGAHVATTAFNVSIDRWLDAGGERTLESVLHDVLDGLEGLLR